MFYAPIKATTYKVTSSNSTLKDRQHYGQQTKTFNKSSDDKSYLVDTNITWDGPDRRSGKDRRLENAVAQQRLDARNKIDRRASKLSIAI